jgi:hypothetical protein
MSFQRHPAPSGLVTETFILRPIRADDAEMDHAAVMESKEYLRRWEQTSWPEDDFTVAANRDDLITLEQRHHDGIAYTYTVLDPARTTCLGCVYIMPHDAMFLTKATITPVSAGDRWEHVDAATYFWVRASALADQTDRVLLAALRRWLAEDWELGRRVFVTNEQFTQQVELIESTDLQLRFHIEEPGKPGRYLAYE